jgi:hypothetical protein
LTKQNRVIKDKYSKQQQPFDHDEDFAQGKKRNAVNRFTCGDSRHIMQPIIILKLPQFNASMMDDAYWFTLKKYHLIDTQGAEKKKRSPTLGTVHII